LKIISWNCKSGFRAKFGSLARFAPDLLVIPECERLSEEQLGELGIAPMQFLWTGRLEKKGLGVFAVGAGIEISRDESYTAAHEWFLPVRVCSMGETEIRLLAVWAMNHRGSKGRTEVGTAWTALTHYADFLKGGDGVVMGDFNNNVIWDNLRRKGTHSDNVALLKGLGYESLYHERSGEEQGKESENTFFMYHKAEKGYHIDYCFASDGLRGSGKSFSIEPYEPWRELSDHVPVVVELGK